MRHTIRKIGILYAAGTFGALISSYLAWYLGSAGIPQRFGVAIAPSWSFSFLAPRLVWGGLWGLLFLAPFWRNGFWTGVFSRGIIFSVLPSLFQLLYVFPVLQGRGMLGLALGKLTPFFIIFYNAVWGFFTAFWLYMVKGDS